MSRFLDKRLLAMDAYTPGEQPRQTGLIKLNTNESPFPPSPRALAAVTPEALENLRLYCDPCAAALRRAIADDLSVTPDQVTVGNGSDELLAFAFQAFGRGGVCFPDVTYGFYAVWAELYGLDARIVPLEADFSIDPQRFCRAGRMIVIANPNAPTGLALPLSAIEEIARTNPDSVVLIDEAYVDFGGESAVPLIGRYPNLLVTRTFSKSRALAGGRLGYAVAQKELIADLDKMRFCFNPYNVNAVTQIMGETAMRDREYFEACRAHILEARAYAADALHNLGFQLTDSRANFLFAAPPDGDGAAFQRALRERNVLVRHFSGARTASRVRISVGDMDQMRRLAEAAKEIYT